MGASRENYSIWRRLFSRSLLHDDEKNYWRWNGRDLFTKEFWKYGGEYIWYDSFGRYWGWLVTCRIFGHWRHTRNKMINVADSRGEKPRWHCSKCGRYIKPRKKLHKVIIYSPDPGTDPLTIEIDIDLCTFMHANGILDCTDGVYTISIEDDNVTRFMRECWDYWYKSPPSLFLSIAERIAQKARAKKTLDV